MASEWHQGDAYEAKQAARAARMRGKAATLRAEVASSRKRDDALLNCMAGTPILVGHHSERRHRRDIDRLDASMRRQIEAMDRAEELDRRAAGIEQGGRQISSDDPDAVTKLRAKLAETRGANEAMKAGLAKARRVVKANGSATRAELLAAGVPERVATFFDLMGSLPTLANGRAEERRIEARIAELEARATRAPRTAVFPGGRVEETDDRVVIMHDQKPPQPTIDALRSRGFVWARSMGAWVRKRTEDAWRAATDITRAEADHA